MRQSRKPRPRQRFGQEESRLQVQLFALRQAVGLLSHHLVSTFLLLAFMCVLLVLPLTSLNLLQNVHHVSNNLNKNAVINLYLESGVSDSDAETLVKELQLRKDLQFDQYISPKAGLAEFEVESGLSDLTQYLQHNPIPGVIVLRPDRAENSLDAINALASSLRALPHVANVVLNTQWLSHAYGLIDSLNQTLVVLTIVVYVLVLVISVTLFHMLLPVFPIEKPYLTIMYLGAMLGIVNGTLSDYIVDYALVSLKELLAQLTFIDASLQSLQLSMSSLIPNLFFAIVTMIIAGTIVHKYRIRGGVLD